MTTKRQLVAKAIYLEWRKPESKIEKQVYGLTTTDANVARVFFNTELKTNELSNTFFHEMAHVFFAFHKHTVLKEDQERLAQKIGTICKEVLR